MSLEETRLYLQQMYEKNQLEGVPSGYWDWDQLSGGFAPGTVTLVGCRPGMGASALALNIANRVSQNFVGTVLYIGQDLSESEVAIRLLQIGIDTPAYKMLDGSIPSESLGNAFGQYFAGRHGSLRAVHLNYLAMEDILWYCRRIGDLRLLIVDGIDRIFDLPSDNPEDWPTEPAPRSRILFFLRELAQACYVPVVCTTRLHRSLERRKNKRPKLRDLAKTGISEEDADQIVFLYRDRYYSYDGAEGAELLIAKSPRGQTGTVHLDWDWLTGAVKNI